MKKIAHVLFLSCLKATELIEKKQNFSLSPIESMQLKMHKMMCVACSHYEKQSELLNNSIEKVLKEGEPQVDIEKLKKSIQEKLTNK